MLVPLAAEWRAGCYSDADWGGDKATRRSVSAGVVMRGGHCLNVWTKKQQVVSLSSAESELYAAVKAASEGLGIQSVAKDLGISCGLNLHLDAPATVCLVNRRGLGKAKARRHAEPVDTGDFQVGPVHHEEGRHERESSRLDDEAATETENRTTDEPHGLRVHEDWWRCTEESIDKNVKACSGREWRSASSALTNAFFENFVNLDHQAVRTMVA